MPIDNPRAIIGMKLLAEKRLPNTFYREDLINEVRKFEGIVDFPLGTVNGDVEYILNFLKDAELIQELEAGGFLCMMQ